MTYVCLKLIILLLFVEQNKQKQDYASGLGTYKEELIRAMTGYR